MTEKLCASVWNRHRRYGSKDGDDIDHMKSTETETRLSFAGCLAALGPKAQLINRDRRPYTEGHGVSSFLRPYMPLIEVMTRVLAFDGLSLFPECLSPSSDGFSLTSDDAGAWPWSSDS